MVVQQMKPYTVGEILMKPSIRKSVEIVLGKESKKKIAYIFLSNNKVK